MATPLILILSMAYACYFINDSLIKYYAPKLDTAYLIRRRTYFSILFASVWLFFSGEWMRVPSTTTTFQIIGIAVLCTAGLFFFVKANQYTSFPNVIVVNLMGLLTQQLVAYLFLQEELKQSYLTSMLLIFLGVFVLASIPNLKKGLFYALMSTLFWSLGYALLSVPLKYTSAVWGAFIVELVILLLALFGFKYLVRTQASVVSPQPSNSFFFLMGFLSIIGSILFNYAYQHYQVSQISLLYMLFYPLSILISKLFFREQLGIKEWIGNGFILTGIIYSQLF
jgi:drug/metabolite transporter (DMT)-like permease